MEFAEMGQCCGKRLDQWFLAFLTPGTPIPKDIGLGAPCLRHLQIFKHYCDKADKLFTTGSLVLIKKTLFKKA